jgi:2-methylcitrate dehydratase PrpD
VAIVAEPAATKRHPRTPYEGKFSLPWDVAALLLDGHLDVGSFAPEQLERDDIRELASRVDVRATDPPVAAAAAPGHVTVTLRGGAQLVGAVPSSSGGPARPLTDDQLDAKFHGNLGGRDERTQQLASLVRDLSSQPDLHHLVAALAITTTEEPTG